MLLNEFLFIVQYHLFANEIGEIFLKAPHFSSLLACNLLCFTISRRVRALQGSGRAKPEALHGHIRGEQSTDGAVLA